jgi:hypothetical protein
LDVKHGTAIDSVVEAGKGRAKLVRLEVLALMGGPEVLAKPEEREIQSDLIELGIPRSGAD